MNPDICFRSVAGLTGQIQKVGHVVSAVSEVVHVHLRLVQVPGDVGLHRVEAGGPQLPQRGPPVGRVHSEIVHRTAENLTASVQRVVRVAQDSRNS